MSFTLVIGTRCPLDKAGFRPAEGVMARCSFKVWGVSSKGDLAVSCPHPALRATSPGAERSCRRRSATHLSARGRGRRKRRVRAVHSAQTRKEAPVARRPSSPSILGEVMEVSRRCRLPPSSGPAISASLSRPALSRTPFSMVSAISGIVLEELARVLAALPHALAVVGEPGAGLLDDAGLDAEIEQLAGLGDALAVHDVELDLPERRGQLVLDHFDAGLVADDFLALLDRADAADIEADRGVEFERIAAGRGLGRAVHHADLHADLVDEDDHALRLARSSR